MGDSNPFENYLNGQYVGAYREEKPFGPHVRECVCPPCHKVWSDRCAMEKAQREAKRALIDPAILAEQDRLIQETASRILDKVRSTPKPVITPKPCR